VRKEKTPKQGFRRLVAITVGVSLLCSLQMQTVSAAVTNQSIAVPMYEYPTIGTFWDDITGVGGDDLPFVIVNPANGPGASVDPTYTAEIAENTTDGIRSIGYVYTTYQTRNFQEVYDDIDDWYQLYPGISGIFIDLIEDNTPQELCYAAGLYNHVKNVHPSDLVILNPGTNINPSYEPYGDIFMNAENTLAVYQASWQPMYPGWDDNPAYQNRFWHAIHTTGGGGLATALSLTRANNAGWVYITDDVMPNPYKVTPTYWNTEVSDVATLPDSTIPNRGKTQLPSGCQDVTASASNATTTAAQQVTTTSTITVANSSSTYNIEPTTRLTFTLPAGVTFASGTGTNWTCNTVAAICDHTATINASQNAPAVLGAFTASCGYSSGTVGATLSNFAGNSSSFTIPVSRPADCAATLVNAGPTQHPAFITIFAVALLVVTFGVCKAPRRFRYSHVMARHRRR
jgi:hypothetical protein